MSAAVGQLHSLRLQQRPHGRTSRVPAPPSLRHPGATRCQNAAGEAAQAPPPAPVRLVGTSRRQVLLGGAAAALCSCCPPPPAGASGWNYTCPGPDAWEGACSAGAEQSPVDIPLPTPLDEVRFAYPSTITGTVINNGHGSPQFSPAGEDAKVTIQGETYALLQMHFHAPSEHTFNGQHALMEAHLVHKHVKTGELAVLGVLLEAGAEKPNDPLEAVLASAPAEAGMSAPLGKPVSLQALLPKARPDGRRAYATYPGSLTTPPCTEGLVWVVFLDKVPVQATQVLQFMGYSSGGASLDANARPVQPLGARQLRFYM